MLAIIACHFLATHLHARRRTGAPQQVTPVRCGRVLGYELVNVVVESVVYAVDVR